MFGTTGLHTVHNDLFAHELRAKGWASVMEPLVPVGDQGVKASMGPYRDQLSPQLAGPFSRSHCLFW